MCQKWHCEPAGIVPAGSCFLQDILAKVEKKILIKVATANCAIQNRLKNMV